ncbi:MAG: SsrA-binding protein SmpB [Clostridiales bacterium]|nr:SsrA-binding protein SmpB [Clostridiales bacterium]
MDGKTISLNRQATHEYFILEKYEAGIVLEGSEVKSLRLGSVNLKDSFCVIQNGELIIKNMHIALYEKAGAFNTKDAKRDRKLLLHKSEIIKLHAKVTQKGLTLVPLRLYFNQSLIKIELGLCQGKHTFDKKRSIMEKDIKREKERELKNYR